MMTVYISLQSIMLHCIDSFMSNGFKGFVCLFLFGVKVSLKSLENVNTRFTSMF